MIEPRLAVDDEEISELWMLALDVPPEVRTAFLDVAREANPDIELEPFDDLHITLMVGDVFEGGSQEDLKAKVESWLEDNGYPLTGSFSGFGLFTAGETPVLVALPDIPLLPGFRQSLADDMWLAGYSHKQTHGYTSHMTLAYAQAELPTLPDVGEVTYTGIIVSYGEAHDVVPINGVVLTLNSLLEEPAPPALPVAYGDDATDEVAMEALW